MGLARRKDGNMAPTKKSEPFVRGTVRPLVDKKRLVRASAHEKNKFGVCDVRIFDNEGSHIHVQHGGSSLGGLFACREL